MDRGKKLVVAGAVAGSVLGIFAALRLVRRHPVGNASVPEPAKAVDLERYLGKWFEIARYEQRFERGCEAATAEYTLRPDGKIDVVNRCRKTNGETEEAIGIARIADARTGAKLKVSFFRPFYGDYWVLDHGDDYEWSIVGEPKGRCLWILSRSPSPRDEQMKHLVRRVAELGYDQSMLVFDRH